MTQKTFTNRLLYLARDLRYKEIFRVFKRYCRGDVLDVGGWDFYLTAKKEKLSFNTWTTLECSPDKLLDIKDECFRAVRGDGCNMQFEDNRFEVVINIQVLEHVFNPLKMVNEIARVLKPDGYGIFLIPQTAVLHMIPDHYYNFTRFWIKKAIEESGLKIVELRPLGGVWSSMASHLTYFFLQSFRCESVSTQDIKRNFLFYILFPLMALYALINIPICMFLSLGDLAEGANNHLVVVRKI